jgi:LytS/YehU family sensor histidine kinase
VVVAIHAGASYFNNYYLFPTYLQKRIYLPYILAIGLTVSLATLMISGIFFMLETDLAERGRELLSTRYLATNGMAIVYTMGITMSLKLVKHWYEKERLAIHLEKLNTETELKYLKSQINPHFLFNSLNSVYALALKKSDDAPDLILKLSDILRYILYDGSERKVSLSQEIKYLKSYLELEKVRHGERMDLVINVEGDVDTQEIAPMLLIPFVENSFKHGLGKQMAKGFVNVDLKADKENLHFSITNSKPVNGSAVSSQKGYQGGIGLKNVQKRLGLLYPKKYQLNINERPNEFNVSLDIKLN